MNFIRKIKIHLDKQKQTVLDKYENKGINTMRDPTSDIWRRNLSKVKDAWKGQYWE